MKESIEEGGDDDKGAIDCPNCGVVTFCYVGDYVCIVCRKEGIPPSP